MEKRQKKEIINMICKENILNKKRTNVDYDIESRLSQLFINNKSLRTLYRNHEFDYKCQLGNI